MNADERRLKTALSAFICVHQRLLIEARYRVECQPREPHMLLNAQNIDGVTIVQLPEKINITNSRAFENDMKPRIAENARLIFDLVQVRQLDSSGLGSIVGCMKHLRGAGGDLKLCGITKPILTIIDIVRLHHLLD